MRTGKTTFTPRSSLIGFAFWLLLIAAVPASAHAAERFAIFRSADRGRSWTRADEGMPGDSRVNAFGALGESVFAGTDSGIFISRDEVRSWQPATGIAMSSGRILCFATIGGSVYAGTDGRGILVSSDGGISWESNAGFPRVKVRSLLAHRGELYAGTDANGVLVSGDGGRSWVQQSNGLPDGAQVFALAAVNGRVFAGLYARGLYAWQELEQRWLKAGEVTPLALASVGGALVAGHNPGGIHWSEDLGTNWFRATVNIPGQSTPSSRTRPMNCRVTRRSGNWPRATIWQSPAWPPAFTTRKIRGAPGRERVRDCPPGVRGCRFWCWGTCYWRGR